MLSFRLGICYSNVGHPQYLHLASLYFGAFCFELFCHQKGVSYFIFLNFRGVPLPAPHREGLSFMNTAACLGLAFPFFSTMTIVEIPHNGRCHRPCDALMLWRGRLRYRTSFDAKSWQAPQTLLGSPAMVGVSGAHALRMNSRGSPGFSLADVVVLSAPKHCTHGHCDAIAALADRSGIRTLL